jgi:hypothetical protein
MEALDTDEGRTLWRHRLPNPYRGGIAISDGALYTSNGMPMMGWTEEDVRSHNISSTALLLTGYRGIND